MQINNTEETKKFLTEITEFFMSVDDNMTELNKQLATKDGEQEDLLHELELSKLNAIDLVHVSKRLVDVRRKRRVIKDNIELIKTLKPLSDTYYKKGINAEIVQTIKNIESLENVWRDRSYVPRVLKDLKCVEVHNEV